MTKKVDFNTSMDEFIAEFPEAKEIFDTFGLDYQEKGKKNISTAAREQNLNLEALVTSLENAIDEAIERERIEAWLNKPLSNIIDHIEKKHHAFLWRKLPSTDMLIDKIVETQAIKDKEFLTKLKNLFASLKNTLEEHLQTEEDGLFVYIKENEELLMSGREYAPSFDKSILNLLIKEHKVTKDILKELRNLTSDYKLSESAHDSVKELYGNLQVLEKDLNEHNTLEDTILFPRIKKLL